MGNHLSVFLSFFLSFADEREERIEAHTAAAATVGGRQQRQQPPHDSPISKCPQISVIIPSCKRIPRFASSSKNSPLPANNSPFSAYAQAQSRFESNGKEGKGKAAPLLRVRRRRLPEESDCTVLQRFVRCCTPIKSAPAAVLQHSIVHTYLALFLFPVSSCFLCVL